MHRSIVRRVALGTVGVLVAAVLPLFAAPPAFAAVTFSFSGGTETVRGTSGNDSISVTCVGGNLWAAGQDSGTACADATHLVVNGLGGNDTLSIQAVDATSFPSMVGCRLLGGPGDDSLQSSPLDDVVKGGGGRDILRPQGGHDLLSGGKGWDELYAQNGHNQTLTNTTYKGLGHATLKGIETAALNSGSGDDTIDTTGWTKKGSYLQLSGGDGNDTLLGGPTVESLNGGAGADTLAGGGGGDALYPDAGTSPSDDVVHGGPGNDLLYLSMYSSGTITDSATTLAGNDTIGSIERITASPASTFPGPVVVDSTAFSGNVDVTGSMLADTFTAGPGDDSFSPGKGNDTFVGHGGTDSISVDLSGGGSVNVSASGVSSTSDGTDSFSGVERAFVYGDATAQTFGASAFAGKVFIYGGGGSDAVNGNGANTTFSYQQALTPVTVTDGDLTTATDDVSLGGSVGRVIVGAASTTSPVSMDAHAFSGAVEFYGGDERDTFIGTAHADKLGGFGGNDVLKGLGGNDILWGATGKDTFRGGPGFDRCDATPTEDATSCEGTAPPLPT
jgi:Ca2+-binding RTX toxin-like protein